MYVLFTLHSTTGKYKPIKTVLEVESVAYYKEHKEELQQKAVRKMCIKNNTEPWVLKRDGYTRITAIAYKQK